MIATREEWLVARKQGLGGSDAPAVMGVSPWKSPFALWAEKTGLEPDLTDNEVLRWGRVLEGPIAEDYVRLTGRRLQYPGEFAIQRHAKLPMMICTLDRIVEPIDDRGPGALSIKYVGPMSAGAWANEPPVDYQVQVQHELAVMGFAWGSFAVLVWGKGVQWLDVERNPNFIEALEDEERGFWRRVERGDAPPVDSHDSTSEAIKRLYPRDRGTTVELGEGELRDELRELREMKAARKVADDRATALENQIKELMGEAAELKVGGRVVATWRSSARKARTVEATTVRTFRLKGDE